MSDLSIQGWMANVQSTMADLGTQVAAAAQTGDFAAVFSQAQSVLASSPTAPTTTSSTTTSASTAGSTAAQATSTLLSTSSPGLGSTTSGSTVVATAEKYLGTPYLWGGTTPSGFDCSGFTQYVYNQLGVSLPRTSEEQALAGTAVPSLADAQPGDLVFFAGSDGTPSSPGHVGIYIGNGQMIDAPETGETVSIQPVGDPVAIRRLLTGDTSGAISSQAGAATSTSTVTSAGSTASGATTILTDAPATSTSAPGTTASATSTASPGASVPSVAVPSDLAQYFDNAASQYGVPVTLLAAVAQVESGFDPNAVSSAGAQGLMQLLPSTAQGLGVNPLDPQQAIDGAAQLLSSYLGQYHSTPMALAAYNAGPAAVAAYGGVPPYPETQSYVQDVMQIAGGPA